MPDVDVQSMVIYGRRLVGSEVFRHQRTPRTPHFKAGSAEKTRHRRADFGRDYSTVAGPLPFSSQARARLPGNCASTRVL